MSRFHNMNSQLNEKKMEVIDLISDSDEDGHDVIVIMDSDEEAEARKEAKKIQRTNAKLLRVERQKQEKAASDERWANRAASEKRKRETAAAKKKKKEAQAMAEERFQQAERMKRDIEKEKQQRDWRDQKRKRDIADLGRHWHAVEGWRG
ncbi:unnamed protein product [Discula destructiva]